MEQDSNKWPERGNNLTALTPCKKELKLSEAFEISAKIKQKGKTVYF